MKSQHCVAVFQVAPSSVSGLTADQRQGQDKTDADGSGRRVFSFEVHRTSETLIYILSVDARTPPARVYISPNNVHLVLTRWFSASGPDLEPTSGAARSPRVRAS